MKKNLVLIAAISLFAFVPFFVQARVDEVKATSGSYSENADGVRQRVKDLSEARAELKEQLKADLAQVAKKVGAKHIDNLVKKYEALKNRVAKMTVLSETQKTEFQAKIQAEITKLEALKTELEAATDISTMKTVLEKVRAQAKLSQTIVKEVAQAIHLNHYAKLLERLTGVYDSFSTKIADLKTAGKDTTKLETSLAEIKTKLDATKTAIDTKNIVEARNALQEARLGMVKLVKNIKTAGKVAPASAEDNEE